jgi:hypothetical protein
MQQLELLNRIADAYEQDGLPIRVSGFPNPEADYGDTLFNFILREISSSFDDGADDDEQLSIARHQLENAIDDLQRVINDL